MTGRERRMPTRAEWRAITSPGLVVRHIPKPSGPVEGPSRSWNNGEQMFDAGADTNPSEARPPFRPGLTDGDEVTRESEGG
jgi:hypothetical protein